MSRVYMYVVDRDFGFAPNPFHGCCTLATCKPAIRKGAQTGDWVIGMGGRRLNATGRCIFAMLVTESLSFNEYWSSPAHRDKRPVRNGSSRMMVGDNIYHHDAVSHCWHQADSHHSNPDGTPNAHNIVNDTKADRVLISSCFFYFGREAPLVPGDLLESIGFRNGRNYRVFDQLTCAPLLAWLHGAFGGSLNLVLADPFDFENSDKRYSVEDNKVR
jgi:hypothetical protein